MRKICSNCMNVFEANTPLEFCPLINCGDGHLVEVDDFLVDIIKKLWELGISTRYCCAGHVEDSCTRPYILFDGAYNELFEDDLSEFRSVLVEINSRRSLVNIGDIEQREDGEIFVVHGVCDPAEEDPREKIKCQIDFAEFFYELIDHMEDIE